MLDAECRKYAPATPSLPTSDNATSCVNFSRIFSSPLDTLPPCHCTTSHKNLKLYGILKLPRRATISNEILNLQLNRYTYLFLAKHDATSKIFASIFFLQILNCIVQSFKQTRKTTTRRNRHLSSRERCLVLRLQLLFSIVAIAFV